MKGKAFLVRSLVGVLVLMLAVPSGTFAQSSGTRGGFTQEELDQMLAPIALYPDSLLAQILVAATYPDQVVEADQWVKSNVGLEGDQLNAALDKMDWDLSVKALVPFPKVLDMMSSKQEWMQRLGEAFLVQEPDVMDSVQQLRSKAYAEGNLRATREQRVVVKGRSIEIVPVNPQAIYVPVYNPAVVYGPWWYPSYPPFAYSPYYPSYVYDPSYVVPGFIAAGALGFATAVTVGSFWHTGWGHWDWGHRNVVVNVNRTVNINHFNVRNTTIRTTSFRSAVRQGKIGSPALRKAAAQGPGKRQTAGSVQRGQERREAASPGRQHKEVREGKRQGKHAAVKKGQAKQAGVKQPRARGQKVQGPKAKPHGGKGFAQGGKRAARGPGKAPQGGRAPKAKAGAPAGGGQRHR